MPGLPKKPLEGGIEIDWDKVEIPKELTKTPKDKGAAPMKIPDMGDFDPKRYRDLQNEQAPPRPEIEAPTPPRPEYNE
jgi:hypothetical protein